MNAAFTIGLIQGAASPDASANLRETIERIRDAAALGAQIICLQELFATPYFCKRQDADRFRFAEPVPGPTTEAMQRLADELDVVLIVPVFERQAAGVYRNSAAVIDAGGRCLGVYRKIHIPDDPLYHEKYYFTPGDASATEPGFKVWRTKYAALGILICWDQWYPEAARITSLLGAEVLFYPTAIGWYPADKAELGAAQVDAWRTAQRAHAIANGVYVAAVNRVGFEPEAGTEGIEFYGHSFVSDPFGRVIAEASEAPAVITARCDPAVIEQTRRSWAFLRDRRIDAYQPILSRWLG
jgi:N-carbamoylputrescine amidase